MSQQDRGETVDSKTLGQIREKTLRAEKKQLHMQRPHNIIPEIKDIVESEIPD